jgi:hypothetical protein
MWYREIQIRAWLKSAGRAQVLVHSSPVGDMRRPVAVRFDPSLAAGLRDVFSAALEGMWFAAGDEALERVADIGRALAAVLLPAPVLNRLVGSLGGIGEGAGLRVRLCLDAGLMDLPWELLYRPDVEGAAQGAGFLVLDPRLSLVREAPRVEQPLPESVGPERLVCSGTFWASDRGPFDRWGVRSEFDRLAKALGPYSEYLTSEFVRTDEGLPAALAGGAAVFHYIGHVTNYRGACYLECVHPAEGVHQRLSGEQVAALLRQARVRLAVFNACYSGRWEFIEPIVRTEVRAVIGVHDVVSTAGAAAFSSAVYAALGTGLTLDEAVSWGRARMRELDQFPGKRSYEWGGYTVYMPSADPVLFPRGDKRARAQQGDVSRDREETVRRVARPLPEGVRMVEALCALDPGEFETVVTGLGVPPSGLADRDQRSRANDLYRRAARENQVDILWQLTDKFLSATRDDSGSRA